MHRDLGAIWRRKGIRTLLMILPVVLVTVIPLVYSAAISLLPVPKGAVPPEALQALLPVREGMTYRQFWMDAFTALLCPILLLAVPIVCSVASASCVFVGEKENGTLETLFLSSMNARSLFRAKITVCTLLSVAVSLISFLLFVITVSVADVMLSAPFFFSFDWLITALFLVPAVALFSVTFVALILPRVHSVGESLQTIGYLLFPLIALYLIQFTGIFRVTAGLLTILALLLFILSFVVYNAASRLFQAETLLSGKPVRGGGAL